MGIVVAAAPWARGRRAMRRWQALLVAAIVAALAGGAALGLRCHESSPAIPTLRLPPLTPEEVIIAVTYPPQWSVGQTWVIEAEHDTRGITSYWIPIRFFVRFRVVVVRGDRIVIEWDDLRYEPPYMKYLVVGTEPFQVRIREGKIVGVLDGWPPEALLEDNRLIVPELEDPVADGCGHYLPPWPLPFAARRHALDREVIAARLLPQVFEDSSQTARVVGAAGLLFMIEESQPRPRPMFVHWRPGEPWWAKLECRPATVANVPPKPLPLGGWGRAARARLIAVNDQPVEVLPWEFPPADWFEGAQVGGGWQRPPPSTLSPFEEYRAAWELRIQRSLIPVPDLAPAAPP